MKTFVAYEDDHVPDHLTPYEVAEGYVRVQAHWLRDGRVELEVREQWLRTGGKNWVRRSSSVVLDKAAVARLVKFLGEPK